MTTLCTECKYLIIFHKKKRRKTKQKNNECALVTLKIMKKGVAICVYYDCDIELKAKTKNMH